jgi:Endosomal/lysosomal potassium channel TMEM175
MRTNRLEAFSDGVLAIIITIMVLEMKVPHGDTLAALRPLIPVFLSYLLSFIYLGIYWNNHHHMLHACSKVTGPILWAKSTSPVLAFAGSLCDRVDGRESLGRCAQRDLRHGPVDGRSRLFGVTTGHHCIGRTRVGLEGCGRP